MKVINLSASAIELYLYMGSDEPIINWLKSHGVKTQDQAKQMLSPYVRSMVRGAISVSGSSLAGAANGSNRILSAFKK